MKIHTHLFPIFLYAVLSGCSGGGGNGEGNGAEGAPAAAPGSEAGVRPPPVQPLTVVTVSPSTPPVAAASIKSVLSGTGKAQPGEMLPVTAGSAGDTLLLAVDARGTLLMAASSTGGTTTLSAESTAIALVRLAMGVLPPSIDAEKANATIAATPRFGALVKQITTMLASAQPLNSDPVMESVGTVTRETMETLRRPASPSASGSTTASTSRLAARVDYQVAPPLPLTIAGDQRVHGVHLTAYKNRMIDVANTMQIVWDAVSSSAPAEKTRLPAAGLIRVYAGATPFWADVAATPVPGNNGAGFELTLEQNPTTRQENLFQIFRTTLDMLLPMAPSISDQCKSEVLSAMISPDELNALLADTTPAKAEAYLQTYSSLKGAWAIISTVSKCAAPELTKGFSDVTEAYAKATLGWLWGGYKGLAKADSIGGLGATMYQTFTYWGTSTTVRVCEAVNLFVELVSCAEQFVFDKSRFSVGPKASFTPNFTALAANGRKTGLPRGLSFSSSDPAIATVDNNGVVKAGNKAGSATISVSQQLTGATGETTVVLEEPAITPNELTMDVGQIKSFQLADSSGAPMDYTDPDTYWEQSPPGYEIAALLGGIKGAWVSGRGTGRSQATVFYAGLSGGIVNRSAPITVNALPGDFRSMTYRIVDCDIDGKPAYRNGQVQPGASVTASWFCGGHDFETRFRILFRAGSENLNVRLEHAFGCEGYTANMSTAGGFTKSWSNEVGSGTANWRPGTLQGDLGTGIFTASGTTNGIDHSDPLNPRQITISYSSSGVWESRPASAFPKCLPPTRNQAPADLRDPYYCSNTSTAANGDRYGCDYRDAGSLPRPGEWSGLP